MATAPGQVPSAPASTVETTEGQSKPPWILFALIAAIVVAVVASTVFDSLQDSADLQTDAVDEHGYLNAVQANNAYSLTAWGEPSDEELLRIGYEYCRDFEATDATGKEFKILEKYRGTDSFEIRVFTHGEALDYLCPDAGG